MKLGGIKNIALEEMNFDSVDGENIEISYNIPATEELMDALNRIRTSLGMKDIVSADVENDVYYDFYLLVNTKDKSIRLVGTVNHSKDDDWHRYTLYPSRKEKMDLFWKVITQLSKELYETEVA